MNETEGINFKVGTVSDQDGGRRNAPKQRGYRHSNPNLEDIMRFIQSLSLPSGDKETLVNAAKKVPHGALANFRANYANYLKKEGRR